jgi:hypothetical protein
MVAEIAPQKMFFHFIKLQLFKRTQIKNKATIIRIIELKFPLKHLFSIFS